MTAVIATQDLLLGQLLDLARSDAPMPCMSVRAIRSHHLKAFNVDTALLALPLQGSKRAREGTEWLSIEPGQIFVVPNARRMDIENIPDPQSGEYIAIGIPIRENVLEAARQLLPDCPTAIRGAMASVPVGECMEFLLAWSTAMRQGRHALADHAVVGMLLHLHALGYTGLLARTAPTLTARIRDMVSAEPARDWSSRDLEHAVGMSGATLRRHLAAEGATLRDIITDTRLAHALMLLYSTRLPVKTVAARAGYASVSSFVKRFSARYGVEPSRIGSI